MKGLFNILIVHTSNKNKNYLLTYITDFIRKCKTTIDFLFIIAASLEVSSGVVDSYAESAWSGNASSGTTALPVILPPNSNVARFSCGLKAMSSA